MEVDETDEELNKLKFATVFLFGVVSRSYNRVQYAERFLPQILSTAASSTKFSSWIVSCFCNKTSINEFFVNNWATEACRIATSILKVAIRKVYAQEKEDVKKVIQAIIGEGNLSAEEMTQLLVNYINDPSCSSPLTLKCLYRFCILAMAKVKQADTGLISSFLHFSILHEFARLAAEFRLVMINFKIHSLCITCAFSSTTDLDSLVPGVKFAEGELDLPQHDDGIDSKAQAQTDFADDDLGTFKCYKLNKFERVVISNLNKDIEAFLYQFKLMSKLMRSCQILNEVKPKYEESPYRMDNAVSLGFVPVNEFINLVQPNDSVLNGNQYCF